MSKNAIEITLASLLTQDFTGKNILIIGRPAAGKSYLIKQLPLQQHTLVHTDDYIPFGFQEALYKLLEDLKTLPQPTCIEGVLGYRLLRKGVELNCYYPDIIIELDTPQTCVEQTYQTRNEVEKLPNLPQFHKNNLKILNDYLAMDNPNKPVWYTVWNEY